MEVAPRNERENLPEQQSWITRRWCVSLAIALVILGGILNIIYLFNHCPFDLSDDEAHYWEWSRHLDYGYYSKPPGIAWVLYAAQQLGASLGITGDGSGGALMPALRLPAVLFGMASGLLSLLLARRIFRDDRAALAVIVLSAAVPMFAVGSLLITIDAPMYLCWAATVYCLWRAVEGNETLERGRGGTVWMYAAGLCAAVGMLFKPVLIALPLCAAVAAWADGRSGSLRRTFFSRHALAALLIMLSSQIPVIVWNANHGWVTFRHILTQGGMGAQAAAPAKSLLQRVLLAPLSRLGEYLGGQAGGMGGILFVLLVIAVWAAWKKARGPRDASTTAWRFLLSFTVPLWGFYFVMNFWKGTEVNWPAASYFTGMILLAGIFVEGWNALDAKHRRTWRSWGTAAVAWGILLTAFIMNAHRAYAIAREKLAPLQGTSAYATSNWNPRKWAWERPLISKLRGMASQAVVVQDARMQMKEQTGTEPLLVGTRYGISSSLAFYLPGHPFVYCLMSALGERQSQYDLWPGLNERDAAGMLVHAGQNALIVAPAADGRLAALLRQTFDRVEEPITRGVQVEGVEVKQVALYRAYGFHGLPETASGTTY